MNDRRISAPFFFHVFNHIGMAQLIPNGFSMGELQSMLKQAPSEDTSTSTEEGLIGQQKLTIKQVEELAENCIQDSLDKCSDPILHKVIVLIILCKFSAWHREVGHKICEQGHEYHDAIPWFQDAGKFDSICEMLMSIQIGNDDFTFDPQ